MDTFDREKVMDTFDKEKVHDVIDRSAPWYRTPSLIKLYLLVLARKEAPAVSHEPPQC